MSATKTISEREYRDSPVFWFVRLEKARVSQDHERAAEAIRELRRLGVDVRYRTEGGRPVNLQLTPDDLRPIVVAVVDEVLAAMRANAATLDGQRLAYTEPEAAAALGIKPHQLRDARLRGEITPTRAGGRIAYERSELLAYLARGRAAQ